MNPMEILNDVAKVKAECLADKKFIKQMKHHQKITGMSDEEISKELDSMLIEEWDRIYLDELGTMLVKHNKKEKQNASR